MLELLWLPFLACLVLTGIHVYLGLHVLARGVIFVDLALAQVAALGITAAFLAGHPIQSEAAYWYALAFTACGAALFSLTRMRRAVIPQEAVIGIVYAVSAAITVLAVDRAPQGSDHIKQLLVGSILTVTPAEVVRLAVLYGLIGVLHVLIRRPLLEISFDPEGARARGRAMRGWDFCFYVTFGVVVTSSVRVAGVLLVFSYLIVPAAVAALLAGSVARRLVTGWALGFLVSVLGLWASFAWDLPTGAAVVATFGAMMAGVALVRGGLGLARGVRERGWEALRGVGLVGHRRQVPLSRRGRLVRLLGRLPGVGPKSAQRIAFHVLSADPADVKRLAAALQRVKELDPTIFTKSGIMVGLGEERHEVLQVMDDLRSADVDFLTIGQYLQPSRKHHAVMRYVPPDEFSGYEKIALTKGFLMVSASPLTRSSHHAGDDFAKLRAARAALSR